MELSLLERFHGDGKHRRYVATCSELSAQLTLQESMDRPVGVVGTKGDPLRNI
jgi:hypothetical protein